MTVALITGSGGLIGSEAAAHFCDIGMDVVGIDNDMRRRFFGDSASTSWAVKRLREGSDGRYNHNDVDIRNRDAILDLFKKYGQDIGLVIHAAAQPSHDWAAREPFTDFDINAVGTINLLEAARLHAPEAVFIFLSTNKVYGDTPNSLPLVERETRYEIEPSHTYMNGIREDMSIDSCMHSVFGASKTAADVMVQEYGRYFDMRTHCFRGGTLTGPRHSAAELHGFLGYVMRCAMTGTHYTVYGYKGKQVRDAIHSKDMVAAFHEVFKAPRSGEVYNIGGGRFSNCSVLEAIEMSQDISGHQMEWTYTDRNRSGDHIWWIGDNGKFESHFPNWSLTYDVEGILKEIHQENEGRWTR
jgi:CDP-paratose 2-epimerase